MLNAFEKSNKCSLSFQYLAVAIILIKTALSGMSISKAATVTKTISKKGSGNPEADLIADLKIEQVIKIAKMKSEGLSGKDMFARVKEVAGTCNSMGVMIEGKRAVETIQDINSGMFAEEIKSEKTELSEEELQEVEAKKKQLLAEIEKRKEEHIATAKQIIEGLTGQPRGTIKAKLVEAKIPTVIIDELLPVESAAAPAAAGAGKPEAKK